MWPASAASVTVTVYLVLGLNRGRTGLHCTEEMVKPVPVAMLVTMVLGATFTARPVTVIPAVTMGSEFGGLGRTTTPLPLPSSMMMVAVPLTDGSWVEVARTVILERCSLLAMRRRPSELIVVCGFLFDWSIDHVTECAGGILAATASAVRIKVYPLARLALCGST